MIDFGRPQKEQVEAALAPYKKAHPQADIEVKQQNSMSLRIRIIDPEFAGMSWADREPEVWKLLDALSDDVFANITMLLLLTPHEAKTSLANREFDDPVPSNL